MEIIYLHHPYDAQKIDHKEKVIAVGLFDGVHLGHQKVILQAKKEAKKRNLPLAVMTFNITPRLIHTKRLPREAEYLTTLEEKEALMEALGVDILYVIAYTSRFSSLSPQEFVDDYFVGLNAKVIVAGYDYTYGSQAQATSDHLEHYAKGRFEVVIVPKLQWEGQKIGSTQIRQALEEGNLKLANKELNRPYAITGMVVRGERRGHQLGYPTANIHAPEGKLIPKVGVYAVRVEFEGKSYWGDASIGYNITFGDHNEKTIEVYLFDFDQELYGEILKVEWLSYLRPEVKFDGEEAFMLQLQQDEIEAKKIQQQFEKGEKLND